MGSAVLVRRGAAQKHTLVICVPDQAPSMAKLVFGGKDSAQVSKSQSDFYDEKVERVPSSFTIVGDIYTCRAEEGCTTIFNELNAFGRTGVQPYAERCLRWFPGSRSTWSATLGTTPIATDVISGLAYPGHQVVEVVVRVVPG
ncbi:hypothetical protein GW17_00060531 [Ensete ventricosum]|nr:hypothetical protein GW17_00060531 [Ensete ventricosum]